mmetsp:Transcript_1781/g.3198  ORF Transcript_1781/g.3198 Transcript_1781/m.3198 type:complete len:267 (+) Transcript_1781:64-864(+)
MAESTRTITLPASLCDALVAQMTTKGLCSDPSDYEGVIRQVLARQCQPAGEPRRKSTKSTPELHGGPEGAYLRDASTGRWRSLSQERPISLRTEVQGVRTQASQKEPLKQMSAGESKAEVPEELRAAQTAAAKAKADTSKLWEAARHKLEEAPFLELSQKGDLQRAWAEVEFEQARQAEAWRLLKESLDRTMLGEITRMAAGCEGGRSLSVGVARNLFETHHGPEALRHGSREPKERRERKARPSLPPRPELRRIGNWGPAPLGGA